MPIKKYAIILLLLDIMMFIGVYLLNCDFQMACLSVVAINTIATLINLSNC